MLAHLVPTATQAALARMAVTDHPAHLVQADPPAPLVTMELRDHPATPPSDPHQPLVKMDHLAKMAHPAHLVKTEPQAQTEAPAHLATKDHPARLAHPETMEPQETRDHQVQTDPRENRVYAPNIAPPTVVCSSKTEQDGKRSQTTFRRLCYTDEKPVIYMSIVVFIFLFNGHLPQSSQSTALNAAVASPVIRFGAF